MGLLRSELQYSNFCSPAQAGQLKKGAHHSNLGSLSKRGNLSEEAYHSNLSGAIEAMGDYHSKLGGQP